MRYTSSILTLACIASGLEFAHAEPSGTNSEDSAVRVEQRIDVLGDRTLSDPGSVSFIGAELIEDISADHPVELLNTLPGVNAHMNSGQEHLIAIRSPVLTGGAGQGSFLVLQNGVPTRSPAFGNVNMLLDVHYEAADLVEVVRGPASAKYGSNAVHGLMNFIFPAETSEGLELSATASTLSRYKSDLTASTKNSFATLSLQHDDGWRDDTSLDQQKLTASHRFKLGDWEGNAWASFVNLNQETAGFIQGVKAYRDSDIAESNPNPEAFRDAQFAMAAVRLESVLGEGLDVSVTPYARWQDMRFRQHFLPYRGFEENSHSGFGVMGDVTGNVNSDIVWSLGSMLDAASGDLKETQPAPFGFFPGDSRFPVGVHYDYTVDTLAAAIWGELEFEIAEDVTILAGLRAETHEYDYSTRAPVGINGRFNVAADRTDNFDLVTPKLGVIWENAFMNTIDLYANISRGQRAPQASDLYRLQSRQLVGQVKSETLDSIEIGARGNLFNDRLFFDLAAYTMEKKNFFFRDSSGLNVPGGKTDHNGVEFQAVFALTDTLDVSGTLSWADHDYAFSRAANGIVSGNQIDTAPEWLSDLKIDWAPNEVFAASLVFDFVGEYYTNPANTRDYNGHTLTSARAAYALSDDTEVFIIARNLFDLEYADRADFAFGNERFFPGEPLNATFGVRKSW